MSTMSGNLTCDGGTGSNDPEYVVVTFQGASAEPTHAISCDSLEVVQTEGGDELHCARSGQACDVAAALNATSGASAGKATE